MRTYAGAYTYRGLKMFRRISLLQSMPFASLHQRIDEFLNLKITIAPVMAFILYSIEESFVFFINNLPFSNFATTYTSYFA